MTIPANDGSFVLPDTTTSLPTVAFEFDPATRDLAAAILDAPATTVFHRLLRDQESPECLLAARRILDAFLSRPADEQAAVASPQWPGDEADAEALSAYVLAVRAELAEQVAALCRRDSQAREEVLRQRAPLALLGGYWLGTVSQPATQPAVVVNRLFAQHFRAQGEGNPQRGVHHLRRRTLEAAGVFLPDIDAVDLPRQAHTRPLTALHGAFYLALSRLPASFLPEVVGVHYAVSTLGVDDLLLGLGPALPRHELDVALAEYLDLAVSNSTGALDRRRLGTALRLAVRLEREHVGLLTELADWQAGLSVEAKAAAIIERHAAYAGRQHRNVRVAGRLLSEICDDPDFDLASSSGCSATPGNSSRSGARRAGSCAPSSSAARCSASSTSARRPCSSSGSTRSPRGARPRWSCRRTGSATKRPGGGRKRSPRATRPTWCTPGPSRPTTGSCSTAWSTSRRSPTRCRGRVSGPV